MRALAVYAALQLDLARAAGDARALARGELLIPIVKGWSTEQANEHASTAVQVHGGMGFIEETGVAQTMRDARITAIYEGTTAIQANDLIGRKLVRDRGAALTEVVATLRGMLAEASAGGGAGAAALAAEVQAVGAALDRVSDCGRSLLERAASSPAAAFAVSVPFLELCGLVFSSTLLVHGALIASARQGDAGFTAAKHQSARFHCAHWLPLSEGWATVVLHGADSVIEARTELI
jgi:acyl-CoA dehydrogenase